MINRFLSAIRSPVKRAGAERYLLVTLLSFAGSITLTRLFLELTGYPQLGSGTLHIAHVLWGGLLLFIAALIPIVFANRWVYTASALLSGIGVGLFIDEVGKFITQTNDYFYPGAAPIIYVFFLLTVVIYFQVKREKTQNPRTELYHAIELLQDVLDHDMDVDERAEMEKHLRNVAGQTEQPDLALMATSLLDFVTHKELYVAPPPPWFWRKFQLKLLEFEHKHLGRTRFRAALAAGVAVTGVVALLNLIRLIMLSTVTVSVDEILENLVFRGMIPSSSSVTLFFVRVGLEGIVGVLMVIGAVYLAVGREKTGYTLAYISLLLELTTINVLIFYFEQFSAIILSVVQLAVLLGLIYYRQRYIIPKAD